MRESESGGGWREREGQERGGREGGGLKRERERQRQRERISSGSYSNSDQAQSYSTGSFSHIGLCPCFSHHHMKQDTDTPIHSTGINVMQKVKCTQWTSYAFMGNVEFNGPMTVSRQNCFGFLFVSGY